MKVTDVRIKPREDGGKTLAMASVTFDELLVVRTFRILDGSDGPWVGFPAFKAGDKWVDLVFPLNKELRDHIKSVVLSAYVAGEGGAPMQEELGVESREEAPPAEAGEKAEDVGDGDPADEAREPEEPKEDDIPF